MANVFLKGSERSALAGARMAEAWDANERLNVTVLVRRRAAADFAARLRALHAGERLAHLTRDQFAQMHAADPADLSAVRTFAARHGLTITLQDAARRTLVLSGTAASFSAAFRVQLHRWHTDGLSYRGRLGPIEIPEELKDIVVAVLGLDDRPQCRPHFRLQRARVAADAAAATSFTPLQLASLYGFPSGTGAGQCVAIVELGGGFRSSDLGQYFKGLNLTPPEVVAVPVDGGSNAPSGGGNGADGEVMLDIEVVGAIAPRARIAVYFAPNTDAGFLDAITAAIHDSANKPSVISISWGGPESSWTAQAMNAMDEAFQAAATMGITVCVASGDNGSDDGVGDGADHVDFPASSPHVLGCGGTSLQASGSAIASESVWNDGAGGGASGGGLSRQFAAMSWQANLSATQTQGGTLKLTQRGVPDVAGNADPQTGYQVLVDGASLVIGGTSAVAPLWAGLLARLNANSGQAAGFLNPRLYQNLAAFRDITQGNNGDFAAAAGWDACTGLGSPNGMSLAGAVD